MVLERQEATGVRYRWTELDGTPITVWYDDIRPALEYAINRAQDKVNAGSVTSTKEP